MQKKEIIEEIVTGISEFKIIPFFGAGMSKSCGVQDWSELIAEFKAAISTDSSSYLDIAQEFENTYGRHILVSKLEI